jgi:glucose/arabinose dehydrogenase
MEKPPKHKQESPASRDNSRKARLRLRVAIASIVVVLVAITVGLIVMPHNNTTTGYKPPAPAKAKPTPSAPATPAPYQISIGSPPAQPLVVADGYTIHTFADHLGKPRDLQFSPGGTLLVSDPGGRRVIALPDHNRDGAADQAKVVLVAGTGVHGLAFYGGKLFVAELGDVSRYNWDEATRTATFEKQLFKLPNPNPDHNLRTLAISPDDTLYASVGSTCNVCRESDPRNATVMVSDTEGRNPHVYASGLRNAPFLAINPTTGAIWDTEMGRDFLGDKLPPDEINILRAGANYGWPTCYGNRIHDISFDHSPGDPCSSTIAPIYQVPAHNAPLGLAFIESRQFPAAQQGDLLVGLHGSWNSSVAVGHKVVRLTVKGDTITGSMDFLTSKDQKARPVDVTFDSVGNLYLSDDNAGAVYIIQKKL